MARNKGNRKPPRQGKKTPTTAVEPKGGKRPAIAAIGDASDKRPVWRFALVDHDGPFAWEWDAFITHHDKLMAIENKTWDECTVTGTIGAKRIPLSDPKFEPAAKKRLEDLELDEADALWELRMGGALRFWGIREGMCFHFLWWDPGHRVYPPKWVRQN